MVVFKESYDNDTKSGKETVRRKEITESTISPSSNRRRIVAIAPYLVVVPKRFLFIGTILPLIIAYGFGRISRRILIEGTIQRDIVFRLQDVGGNIIQSKSSLPSSTSKGLPAPKIRDDKAVPKTLYSSKNFDTAASASARSILVEKKYIDASSLSPSRSASQKVDKVWHECDPDDIAQDGENTDENCQVSAASVAMYGDYDEDEDDDEESLHLPAGQHLLVDIKEVDPMFLNDEHRLAQAMVDVVWESDLTLLSYHCHTLHPCGVTCVGVLLESHISFHTWPEEGVITLDLFTCGAGLLIPVLPIIERLFGVPQVGADPEAEKPTMVWAHKLRGFRPENDVASRPLQMDLGRLILGVMDLDMKEEIASVKTEFQQIDIYDVIDPKFQDIRSHRRSLAPRGSTYESNHTELYLPDRRVFLDGTIQSTGRGNEPYHEALVHPGMLTHSSPKRVAIIGGGEGATLREVLKHDTVEHVKMIEIDQGMVETSKEYLPTWNDCSDIVGSTKSCFEDFRAEILFEDAMGWFVKNFGAEGRNDCEGNESEEEKFDVIIMDALDPESNVEFAGVLYGTDDFTISLYDALNDDGILILQLGETPWSMDPPEEMGKMQHRDGLIQDLTNAGFDSMHAYSEEQCGFGAPWSYIIACKDYDCRRRWYATPAEFDLAIHERVLRTYSGQQSLKYVDGATMQRYQVPSKAFEIVYCRKTPMPEECSYLRGYDPLLPNVPAEEFTLGQTRTGMTAEEPGYDGGDGNDRGIFARIDIKAGSMIMQEKSVHAFSFHPSTFQVMENLYGHESESDAWDAAKKELSTVFTYLNSFGYENSLHGKYGHDAPSCILSYVKHGCNGTQNINSESSFTLTESSADAEHMPATHYPKGYWKDIFNPVVDRHLPHLIGGFDIAVRDIGNGEEILDNFLTSVSSEENWEAVVNDLVVRCQNRPTSAQATK